VNPDKGGLRENISEAMSLSPGPWRFLTIVTLAWDERLKELDKAGRILRIQTKAFDEAHWLPILNRYAEETHEVVRQMRRAMHYLRLTPKLNESQTRDAAKWLEAAEWNRTLIERGYPDELIAMSLKDRFDARTTRKSGRPAGSSDPDTPAMLAFRLRELAPADWSYPRLADHLFDCKCQRPHTANSECVDKLKKAVKRLHNFLQELGYEGTGK